ncbi:MAG TPA: hypothetical protein VG826_14845 [Pirellulales bacterium]|nr:hypothetical protein [Pirellulales bacterium]
MQRHEDKTTYSENERSMAVSMPPAVGSLRRWSRGALRVAGVPSLLLSLGISVAPGCASLDLPSFNMEKYIPMLTGRTGQFRRPMKVVAFWSDTVRTADGQPAMRGFGGRLMFYDSKTSKPLKVAGTLVIYGFDEGRIDPENPRPDRKFVFTPEQFAKHYSKSELGHSYSVWVPWDRAGGETKEIGLICRFTPVEGGAIVSEQVRQVLPGVEPASPAPAAPTAATAPAATPVKLLQYEVTAQEAERRMATTTIDLNGPPDRRLPTALARPRPNFPVRGDAGAPTNPTPAAVVPNPAAGASNQSAAPTADRAGAPSASGSWLARFGPHQSRAPGAPIAPPDRARGPWQPTHVVPPSVPPATPTSILAP